MQLRPTRKNTAKSNFNVMAKMAFPAAASEAMPPRPRIALKRRRAKQCRRCAPQSAARLPSHARYGVRAVDRWIETQGLMAKPCTPHLHCAARAVLQALNCQCKFSLGGSKGGISLFEKRYPSLVRAAPAGAAVPAPSEGRIKRDNLFGKRIPPLSGSGVQRRMIHAARGKTRAFFKKPYSSICAARY